MRKYSLSAVLALTTIAWSHATTPLALKPESRLWINGTSTVRGFECSATAFDAKIESSGPGAVKAVVAGEKLVQVAELRIPAASLDCRNGTMNEHMRKALKAKENPTIEFRIDSYDLAKSASGARGTGKGTLTLGGVQKIIDVAADITADADGSMRVTGKTELRMTEFGLKPPTLMMGTMRVNEKVTVNFDLRVTEGTRDVAASQQQ
jgi:polyisoprenoid-binding protein YceI